MSSVRLATASKVMPTAGGCNRVIEWWVTPHGKRMPMDVTDSGKVETHWATCPKVELFRKGKSA
jgi:hypothetical protein